MNLRTFPVLLPAMLLLGACAAVASFEPLVVPAAAGKPAAEVVRLASASEAKLFPCYIHRIEGTGAAAVDLGGERLEVTLVPGRYRVTLRCTNNAGHSWKPDVEVTARAGKRYQVTGYFIDDSITIFNMKMLAKVAEI